MLRIDSVVRQPDGGSVLWTADVCLVDLDNAPQGFPVRRDHRSSQFMEHRPNRFVAVQAKLPLDSWSWNSQGGFGINRSCSDTTHENGGYDVERSVPKGCPRKGTAAPGIRTVLDTWTQRATTCRIRCQ